MSEHTLSLHLFFPFFVFEIQPLHEATCQTLTANKSEVQYSSTDFDCFTAYDKSSSAMQFILKSPICRHKML